MKKIQATLKATEIASNDPMAYDLAQTRRFGEKSGTKVIYLPQEAVFLVESGKMEIYNTRGKILSIQEVENKCSRMDKFFPQSFLVYKDLRKKGYIVKSGLKFGANFRVYDKDIKSTHAKWIVFVTSATQAISWQDFAAKNRVAHSTAKKLLIAIIDNESKVSYYAIEWLRP